MIKSFSTRLSIYVLGVTIVLFILSFSVYFHYSRQSYSREVIKQQTIALNNLTDNIEFVLAQVELSTNSSIHQIKERVEQGLDFEDILKNVLNDNEAIQAFSVGFEPYKFKKDKRFYMPYIKRENDGLAERIFLGESKTYEYHSMSWYAEAVSKNEAVWSEPYFGQLGGVATTSYTVPIHDNKGVVIGAIIADVSLDWITDWIDNYNPYPNSRTYTLSRKGYFISHSNDEHILTETYSDVAQRLGIDFIDQEGKKMLAGESGYGEFDFKGQPCYAFYQPIANTGWSVGTISLKADIYGEMNKIIRLFWIVVIAALMLIFIFIVSVIRKAVKPLHQFAESTKEIARGDFNIELPEIRTRDEMYHLREAFVNMQSSLSKYVDELESTTKERTRVASELSIATKIQMGMLPTVFPPYPQLPLLDLYAMLKPAKEIGGDLYDFFVEKDMLYFTVGDASGKGVPASLLMAVTSSLFRSIAKHLEDPSEILYSLNNSISEKNDALMFITLFVGVLNVKTGVLNYSSAGHSAPVLVSNGAAEFIDVAPNVPLGIMPNITFTGHSITISRGDHLILYSDGLTEARNRAKDFYSDERLLSLSKSIHSDASAKECLNTIHSSVIEFVDGWEQSDDLTMLVVKLKEQDCMNKELIINNDINDLTKVVAFIKELGEGQNFDVATAASFRLALEEVISNIILHAYPEKMGEEISIKFKNIEKMVVFTISDYGVEFDPTKVKDADITLSAEEREIGGLGIFLVKQIMDEVRYERIENKNILTLTKNV